MLFNLMKYEKLTNEIIEKVRAGKRMLLLIHMDKIYILNFQKNVKVSYFSSAELTEFFLLFFLVKIRLGGRVSYTSTLLDSATRPAEASNIL